MIYVFVFCLEICSTSRCNKSNKYHIIFNRSFIKDLKWTYCISTVTQYLNWIFNQTNIRGECPCVLNIVFLSDIDVYFFQSNRIVLEPYCPVLLNEPRPLLSLQNGNHNSLPTLRQCHPEPNWSYEPFYVLYQY